jgi:hypothetical protein
MMDLTDIESKAARAFAKAAVEKPWVTKTAFRTYRVIPRNTEHGKYVVTFDVIDRRRMATCESVDGTPCPAHAQGLMCYHIAAAYRRHLSNAAKVYQQRQQPAVAA